jgi:hypothetical protein
MPHDSLELELAYESGNICADCSHECHCETIVCDALIGVGMTDKEQECLCPVCKCNKK